MSKKPGLAFGELTIPWAMLVDDESKVEAAVERAVKEFRRAMGARETLALDLNGAGFRTHEADIESPEFELSQDPEPGNDG
jgi:hypothetical protein